MITGSYFFNPIQPEMEPHCPIYMESKPKCTMSQDVSLYYQFKTDENSSGELSVIPDGCIDLLFSCDPSDPFAIIATSPEERCFYQFKPNIVHFGVRLYPEQTSIMFKCSIKEIIQQKQIPLFDVLDGYYSLFEDFYTCTTFNERIIWFKNFLKKQPLQADFNQNIIHFCLNKIYETEGLVHIKQLSSETGYSSRYIQKKFEDQIGFSPKQFSQIVRLQYTVNKLLNMPHRLNDIIDAQGYYDEAHFYKGFKKYMTVSPKQYRLIFN
ncbi:helix-turn-helix domain-containing protein [Metabacillus litoralis]|uniref:helix-turn-helix domain-containing protein n=1 Tax=Metabacillus litoralis TaxID=152268 RepID=UPI00203AB147|nr:AraC family transcriptional regulator [Metabacillus litoralis]MCM3411780.1 AraC family transcriptional regulator [Metabacillus litoralis]